MAGKFSSVTGSSREISDAAYRSRESQQKKGIHWEEASMSAHTFRETGHLQSRGGAWEKAKSRLFLRTGFYWGGRGGGCLFYVSEEFSSPNLSFVCLKDGR